VALGRERCAVESFIEFVVGHKTPFTCHPEPWRDRCMMSFRGRVSGRGIGDSEKIIMM
jgi:hypothetical protein